MTEITVPRLGWSMEQGTFLGWLKADGDSVRAGEPLFTLEGDKSAQEVEAVATGTLRIPPDGPKEGDVVLVGAVLGHLEGAGVASGEGGRGRLGGPVIEPGPSRGLEADPGHPEQRQLPSTRPVTPRAYRAARERGIDPSSATGTGKGGRVRERDILALAPAPRPSPAGVRRVIAERLMHSLRNTAPVTLTAEADAGNLTGLRRQFKESGQPVPAITGLIVKLSALALRQHPGLNAVWEDGAARLIDEVHVGVAVDAEAGLLVPVIRHADRLPLRELSERSAELVKRARDGRLSAADMEGGTFTVSNLGAFGIDAFTPIINWPQAAILGVGRIAQRPVAVEGAVVARERVTLSLTFDHRVVDGAPAARFLQAVVRGIESPAAWLIG